MSAFRSTIRYSVGFTVALSVTVVAMLGASTAFFPATSSRADTQLGEGVFQRKCASCHTVEPNQPPTYGPSLYNIGETAATRQNGVLAEEHIFESIVNPSAFHIAGTVGEMPGEIALTLSRDELLSVVAYLCSQGAEPDYRVLVTLVENWIRPKSSKQLLQLSSLERGRTLFFKTMNCYVCHTVDGPPDGNLIAPDLSQSGLHTRKYLRESIDDPSAHIVKGYELWTVLNVDGVSFSGRRLPSREHFIRLAWIDKLSNLRVAAFQHQDLEELETGQFAKRQAKSPMPSFRKHLSREDLDALLDFLSTLR